MAARTLPNPVAPRFNFTPFTAPIPRTFLRQFKQNHRVWWPMSRQVRTMAESVVVLLIIGGAILGVLRLGAILVLLPFAGNAGLLGVAVSAFGLGFVALVVIVLIGVLRRDLRFGPGWTRMARLDTFASLNYMTYQFERRDIHYSGAIFSLGTKAVATDAMTVQSGRGIQIGNYKSVSESVYDNSRFIGG